VQWLKAADRRTGIAGALEVAGHCSMIFLSLVGLFGTVELVTKLKNNIHIGKQLYSFFIVQA
jgi:hypothetical protein